AAQLAILQRLAHPHLDDGSGFNSQQINFQNRDATATPNLISLSDWVSVEHLLRQYAEYHLGRSIRSATLIDTYVEQFQLSYSF
ncbi:MAG: DNA repair protein RecO, partial [Cyanobacteriota bacterium]|nr:DNA repair protein RecO [Cyanobacteriota bacterium]